MRVRGRTIVAGSLAAAAALSAPGYSKDARVAAETFRTPVADTYVSSAAPRTNFGGAQRLVVNRKPEHVSLLRFDVSGLAKIQRATLALYSFQGERHGVEVRSVAGSWGESSVTYLSAP